MTSYLQGKYGHCNTYRFVRQFKKKIPFAFSNGSTRRRTSQTRARVLVVACVVRTLANPNQKNRDIKLCASTRASAFLVKISGGQNSSPRKFPSCLWSIMTTNEQWRDALVTSPCYLPCRAGSIPFVATTQGHQPTPLPSTNSTTPGWAQNGAPFVHFVRALFMPTRVTISGNALVRRDYLFTLHI